MVRFKRIVHHFRHLQLPRPVFVVRADGSRVKAALHALFEESSRAKYFPHRRLRQFGGGRAGRTSRYPRVIFEGRMLALGGVRRSLDLHYRGFVRRIGCALCQKSAFTPARENMETSYDSIPFPIAPPTACPPRARIASLLIQG